MSCNDVARSVPASASTCRSLALVVALAFAAAVPLMRAMAATEPVYPIEGQAFLMSYLKNADTLHYQPHANFKIPAIWLFAPDGQLVSITDAASNLPQLNQHFPPSSTKAMSGEPPLQTMEKVLGDATGNPVSLQGAATQWTALLFYGDSPECKSCASFKQTAEKFEHANSSTVHLVSLFVK